MTATEPLLVDAQGLSRWYGARAAVSEVDLKLARGEILGFLGLNGAGKTTTMRMLAGTLAPHRGTIRIAGRDLLEEPRAAKRLIGYLPEHPPLHPELTVEESLRFAGRLHGVRRRALRAAVDAVVERTGLGDVRRRLVAHLSKGYQQRLGLAQAVLHQPEVLILDEPTVGLDPAQIQSIRTLIAELGREHGVLLSSHLLHEVESVCTRVTIIHEGRIVLSEALGEIGDGEGEERSLLELERPPPSLEALGALPGVRGVEAKGASRYLLRHEAGVATRAAILAKAAQEGWRPAALAPQRRDLEDVFLALTLGRAAPAGAAS
jgi:ABC-2 type transport system ATP-binding protein